MIQLIHKCSTHTRQRERKETGKKRMRRRDTERGRKINKQKNTHQRQEPWKLATGRPPLTNHKTLPHFCEQNLKTQLINQRTVATKITFSFSFLAQIRNDPPTLAHFKKKKGKREKNHSESWVFLLVCLLCFPYQPRTHCFSFFLSWMTTRVRVGAHASLWQIEGQLPFPRGSVKSFPHDLQGRVVGELQVVDAGHDGGQEVVRVLPGLKRLAHDGQGRGQAAETWNMQLVMQSLHQEQCCFSSPSLQLTLCCPPPPHPSPHPVLFPTVPLPCLALCCSQLFLSLFPLFAVCCSQLFLSLFPLFAVCCSQLFLSLFPLFAVCCSQLFLSLFPLFALCCSQLFLFLFPLFAVCCSQLFLSLFPLFALCCSQLFLAITQCSQGYLTTTENQWSYTSTTT